MDHMQRHNIKDLEGTFMYMDTPVVEFCIQNYCPVYIRELNRAENYCNYPIEFLFDESVTYGDLNDYFKHHVVEDGAQDIHGYLRTLGLHYYELDEIVKRNNGYNFLDLYWVKFKGFGAQNWHEIQTQSYPIYT